MKYKIRLARLSDTKFVIRTLMHRYPIWAKYRGAARRSHILPRLFDHQWDIDVNENNITSYCSIVKGSYSGNLKLLIIDDNNTVVFIGSVYKAEEWAKKRFDL